MPSGKPRPHRGQATQRHVLAIQAEKRRLESLTIEGWRQITDKDKGVPELEGLRALVCELMFGADPMKGRTLGGIGRSHETLSADGRSTVEGRDTLAGRDHLEYVRRQLRRIVYDMKQPVKGVGVPKRRCENPEGCSRPGRLHSAFDAFCRYCGHPFSRAA